MLGGVKNVVVVLVMVLAVNVVSGQVVFPLNCPNYAVVQDFNSTEVSDLTFHHA